MDNNKIPVTALEQWLYDDPESLASVKRGLEDAAQGRISAIDLKAL